MPYFYPRILLKIHIGLIEYAIVKSIGMALKSVVTGNDHEIRL